ncbi:hypothetical protein M0R72_02865 [Candidatus Pacearchaeota archaeon]|nr:hypothetical protein [Candidatus Pacearchaeota archaeon]
MNLSVYAKGDITTPNGNKRYHRESGPLLSQTRSDDSYEIYGCVDNKTKYALYKQLYGDPGGILKKWLLSMELDGFEIVWEVH